MGGRSQSARRSSGAGEVSPRMRRDCGAFDSRRLVPEGPRRRCFHLCSRPVARRPASPRHRPDGGTGSRKELTGAPHGHGHAIQRTVHHRRRNRRISVPVAQNLRTGRQQPVAAKMAGEELAGIARRHGPARFEITADGQSGTVRHLGWFGERYSITTPAGELTATVGNASRPGYELTGSQNVRASVSRQFARQQELAIEVADGEDAATMLVIVLALGALREDQPSAAKAEDHPTRIPGDLASNGHAPISVRPMTVASLNSDRAQPTPDGASAQLRVWSGAGSNRRPSAFQADARTN
jgi:hypothetical protein